MVVVCVFVDLVDDVAVFVFGGFFFFVLGEVAGGAWSGCGVASFFGDGGVDVCGVEVGFEFVGEGCEVGEDFVDGDHGLGSWSSLVALAVRMMEP